MPTALVRKLNFCFQRSFSNHFLLSIFSIKRVTNKLECQLSLTSRIDLHCTFSIYFSLEFKHP